MMETLMSGAATEPGDRVGVVGLAQEAPKGRGRRWGRRQGVRWVARGLTSNR